MSSSIGQNPTFCCQQFVMKYCHGWLKFGWNIVSDIVIATLKIYTAPLNLQELETNVKLPFSVGDTIPRYTISFEKDNWKLWH